MLGGQDTRVIYRHYATLYFVFVVDESESELGILDLIQVTQTSFLLSLPPTPQNDRQQKGHGKRERSNPPPMMN